MDDSADVMSEEYPQPQPGTVVFLKSGAESDSTNDIWDDTALIKAYDQAVQQVHQANADLKPHSSKSKKKKKQPKKQKTEQAWRWAAGNQCRAIYSEDGLVYDAVITEMLGHGKCIVQYTEYGNEEEQNLWDLLRPSKSQLQPEKADSLRSQSPARSITSCSDCSTPQHSTRRLSNSGPQHRLPAHNHGAIPSFVPPPPPSIPGMMGCDDEEAFHSMLISWYMSGFHTGYYQGMRDGKNGNRMESHQ